MRTILGLRLLGTLVSLTLVTTLAAETTDDANPPGLLHVALPVVAGGQSALALPTAAPVLASIRDTKVDPADPAAAQDPLPQIREPPLPPASLFDGRKILAFYGRPGSKSMGILGEYPKEELAALLFAYAKLYDNANGGAGVIPAFYIVYGTCWPGGDLGYLRDSVVEEWVDYAARNGIMVILDSQIGRFGVDDAIKRLLPWLSHPNVHLALDPEWRTTDPMKTIGSVTADELNQAQAALSDWLAAHGDTSERILVIHQFTAKMISDRNRVRADYPGVRLIHSSDGFGSPPLKKKTYAYNALADNMPRKGFKLFMKTDVRGAGYDEPLLTPAEVIALDPSPEMIIYQ